MVHTGEYRDRSGPRNGLEKAGPVHLGLGLSNQAWPENFPSIFIRGVDKLQSERPLARDYSATLSTSFKKYH